MTVGTRIIEILKPYIGDTAADTCVRATAERVGKSLDEIGTEDIPAIEKNVRHLLSLVAPPEKIDGIIEDVWQVAEE